MNGVWLALLVGAAGGIGAVLRYLVTWFFDGRKNSAAGQHYPWGTTVVNLSGAFVMGLVSGPVIDQPWAPVVLVGLLGGYTTFSTTSLDTIELLERKRVGPALANSLGMLGAATALVILGVTITLR